MPLSDEERQPILKLLADGLSSEQIAARLGVPKMRVAAVKAHITMGTYGAGSAASLDASDLEEVEDAADLKFGLERDMQQAIRQNISQLDPDLRIVDGGKERHVAAGFIDILAEDGDSSLVVIELKSGKAPDDVVTQVLAYVGSLLAEDSSRPVRAVVIAREFSERVRHAARAASIELYTYGYSFAFSRFGMEDSPPAPPGAGAA